MFRLALILLSTCCSMLSLNAAAKNDADVVEIYLLSNLDDKRGYCLDIRGFQNRAKVERGLQAHTCYSYRGSIAIDQGFDVVRLNAGEFFMPGFSVCMTTSGFLGTSLGLSACTGSNEQRFALGVDGLIHPTAAPELCLTVKQGAPQQGRGGRPVHLMRDIQLTKCEENLKAFQTWGVRRQAPSTVQHAGLEPDIELPPGDEPRPAPGAGQSQDMGLHIGRGPTKRHGPNFGPGVGRDFGMNQHGGQGPRFGRGPSLEPRMSRDQGPEISGGDYALDPARQVSNQDVQRIIAARCAACHATGRAPKGLVLETLDDVRQNIARVRYRALDVKTMPPGNMTRITPEERAMLGRWLDAQ